jgi:hypothetical protein
MFVAKKRIKFSTKEQIACKTKDKGTSLVEVESNKFLWQQILLGDNAANSLVDGRSRIVERWRLHDDAKCSTSAQECENDQEEAI